MAFVKRLLQVALAVGAFGSSSLGVAGGVFPSLPEMLDHEWESHQVLSSRRLQPQNFGLDSFDAGGRHQLVRVFLSGNGLHPLVSLVEKPSSIVRDPRNALGLQGSASFVVRDYALRVGNYEICKSSVRSVETPDGGFHVLGVTPQIDAVYPFHDDAWMALEEAIAQGSSRMGKAGLDVSQLVVSSHSRCLYPQQNQLQPAWRLVLRVGNYPYLLYVGDSEVFEGDVLAFDATANIMAFSPNPSTGDLKTFEVTVNGDGYMTNDFFTTADAGSTGRLFSSGNSFLNKPGSAYFAEQSSFAHVNEHFDYSVASGYSWVGPKPLTVKTHVVFSEGPNNAMYSPFDGSSGPYILIGDGDGSVFQGLPFDSDVVSHEFGHHIIFSSLTETKNESLVIHEGLADAIVFLRTGDACLGESICPVTSNSCQVKGSCLRTGNNSMKYKDASYNAARGAHIQGQLVSGLMWDLRKGGKIPASDLSKLSIGMVAFLPAKADMQSLITAILNADVAMFGKQYQSTIVEAASNRGLGIDTLGIDLGTIDGTRPVAAPESSSSSSSKGKGFLGLCSIGASEASGLSAVWIGIILLAPIAAQVLSQRPRRLPVKVKKDV